MFSLGASAKQKAKDHLEVGKKLLRSLPKTNPTPLKVFSSQVLKKTYDLRGKLVALSFDVI